MSAPPPPIVEVRGLSLTINGRAILENIEFEIGRGESVTIVGPNGAGKTTLLKCIGGLLNPTAGGVLLDGKPLADYRRRELAERIAYVPQSSGQMLPCTVYEFVLMARYAHFGRIGGVRAVDRAAAQQAMADTGTEDLRNIPLRTLSGGQRQKVMIAAAVAQDAPILLLDEPATFLDYKHEMEIRTLIERLHRESGRTLIAVSHDLNQGALDCERIVALSNGTVAFNGVPRELLNSGRLESIFDTSFDIVEHPHSGRTFVIPLRRQA